MKLGFFTMPIHPLDKDWRKSLREDREAFILADKLGFTEGLCRRARYRQGREHHLLRVFIASLIDATKKIKLGTARSTCRTAIGGDGGADRHARPHAGWPFQSSASVRAVCSPTLKRLAISMPTATRCFLRRSNAVLAIWAGAPPYDIDGKYWKVKIEQQLMPEIGQGYLRSPCRSRNPPIVVTAVAPFSKGVTEAAARGWDPISANFLMPEWVKSHWPKYVEGCERVGRKADPANWRVAKSIFVADNDKTAKAYAMGATARIATTTASSTPS